MCKDGEVLREEDEDSEARDSEVENHREGGIENTSSDSGRSVDQHGYLSEYEDQVHIHVDMFFLFQFCTMFLLISRSLYYVKLKISKDHTCTIIALWCL